jgi:hypothetical protein
MKPSLRSVAGVMWCAAAVGAAAAAVRAETCKLELKRQRLQSPYSFSPGDDAFRPVSFQTFFKQLGLKETGRPDPSAAEFARVVKKEPAYRSKLPFRGVAKLGSDRYGFALDYVAPTPAAKDTAKDAGKDRAGTQDGNKPADGKAADWRGYNRLHFDLNHNGDLTDDKPIEGQSSLGPFDCEMLGQAFPRVDLTAGVDGAKVDYSFFFSVSSQTAGDFQYVSIMLMAGAYREGKITLEGRERRVVLIDSNSNGRFDDEARLGDQSVDPAQQAGPQGSDQLLLDPDLTEEDYRSVYDVTRSDGRHHVSKRICVDGRLYDLKISPAGDRLTLSPCPLPVGYVTHPSEHFRALLAGDQGVVKITGGKSKPVPLPEGNWKLLGYTIDLTAARQEAQDAAGKKQKEQEAAGKKGEKPKQSALLRALAKAVAGSAGVLSPLAAKTLVSAGAGKAPKPVVIRKGETVALPFGPPYKPIVKVEHLQQGAPGEQRQVRLALSLVGSGGEEVTDLLIDGRRPSEKPEFTISTAKGEVVERGSFEWG